jgi:hypothetical protein
MRCAIFGIHHESAYLLASIRLVADDEHRSCVQTCLDMLLDAALTLPAAIQGIPVDALHCICILHPRIVDVCGTAYE